MGGEGRDRGRAFSEKAMGEVNQRDRSDDVIRNGIGEPVLRGQTVPALNHNETGMGSPGPRVSVFRCSLHDLHRASRLRKETAQPVDVVEEDAVAREDGASGIGGDGPHRAGQTRFANPRKVEVTKEPPLKKTGGRV